MIADTLVSIIVPVYNASKYLNVCIDSILKQTYKNIELILVDDGSTDDSASILKYRGNNDYRIKVIFQDNKGAPTARNKGIMNSKGNYIMLFDSDDILEYNAIEVLLKGALKTGADITLGNFNVYSSKDSITLNEEFKEQKLFCQSELINCTLFSPLPGNKLYKSELINKYNIQFANVRLGQDLNFYQKMLSISDKVYVIKDCIMSYRIVPNSVSRSFTKKVVDIIDSLNDVEDFYRKNNVEEKFFLALKNVRVKHYYAELTKLPKVTKKSDRIEIMQIFRNECDKIKIPRKKRKGSVKKRYTILRLEIYFWRFYCSEIFNKGYFLLRKIMKRGN